MTKGVGALFNGVVGLSLSLIVLWLTGNYWGWAVLFGPAGVFTLWGLYRVFVQDDV